MQRLTTTNLLCSALLLAAACSSDDAVPYFAPDTEADVSSDVPTDTEPDTADTADADAPDAVDTADGSGDTGPIEFVSHLRVVHASPDTPALSLYLDGEPVVPNVQPLNVYPGGGLDGSYFDVDTGTYDAALVPVGATLEDALISDRWRLSEFAYYTVTIAGLSGIEGEVPEGAEMLRLVVSADDLSEEVDGSGNPLALVRFFHTAVGSGPLDFFIEDTTVDEGVAFGLFSFDEHLLPAATFTMGYRLAGTGDALVSAPVTLGNSTTNLWAGGRADEDDFWLMTIDAKNDVQILR